MPIESCSAAKLGKENSPAARNSSRIFAKKYRVSSSLPAGGTHISPFTERFRMSETNLSNSGSPPGRMPDFCSSPPILISIRTGWTSPAFCASLFISSASASLSTDWISSALPTTYFALFVCSAPIKCGRTPCAVKNPARDFRRPPQARP